MRIMFSGSTSIGSVSATAGDAALLFAGTTGAVVGVVVAGVCAEALDAGALVADGGVAAGVCGGSVDCCGRCDAGTRAGGFVLVEGAVRRPDCPYKCAGANIAKWSSARQSDMRRSAPRVFPARRKLCRLKR